jgi:hypothetical protein
VDLAERSRDAPTIVPRSPAFFQMEVVATFADILLLMHPAEPVPDRLDRLKDRLDRLVVRGRPFRPELREQGLLLVAWALTAQPSKPWREAWNEADPQGAARYRERRHLLCDLGRRLLDDWQRDLPKSCHAWTQRAVLENWVDNYQSALSAARRAATLATTAAEREKLRIVEAEALAGLRSLPEVRQPPRKP